VTAMLFWSSQTARKRGVVFSEVVPAEAVALLHPQVVQLHNKKSPLSSGGLWCEDG